MIRQLPTAFAPARHLAEAISHPVPAQLGIPDHVPADWLPGGEDDDTAYPGTDVTDPITAALHELASHQEQITQLDERETGHFTGLTEHLAELTAMISVGNQPGEPGERPFNRMSFTVTTAFPSYRFEFAGQLVGDPSGKVIPLDGQGVLEIVFTQAQAQAHTADGTRASVISLPVPRIGYQRMAGYAQGGGFEGVLSYGIGITQPILHSNPQSAVRAHEGETVTASGQHRYTIAMDIDATNPA